LFEHVSGSLWRGTLYIAWVQTEGPVLLLTEIANVGKARNMILQESFSLFLNKKGLA